MNAFDGDNPYARGPREGDEKLYVKFYMGATVNDGKSREAGHPVYDDVPMVTIRVPGDKNTVVDTRVEEEHQYRFPKQWEQFQRGQDQTQSGWPLREWPAISRGLSEELAHLGVFTVESLAAMPDGLGARVMGFYELKKKAAAALALAKDGAVAERLAAENGELKTTLEAQQKQINELGAKLLALTTGQQPAMTNEPNRPTGNSGRR